MQIELVNANALNPSTYNPRTADPERLGFIELSLSKLGFLLPLFASKQNGEITSGHQRHLVATERLGCKTLPVCWLDNFDLAERKALNIVFNRATNDMTRKSNGKVLKAEIIKSGVLEAAALVADKDVDSPDFYPCLKARKAPIKPLLSANSGDWSDHACTAARALMSRGIEMPVLAGSSMRRSVATKRC